MKSISLITAVVAFALAGCASLTGGRNDPTQTAAVPGAPKLQDVQEVHRKMMASTTPEERASMMNDHQLVVPVESPMAGQMKAPVPTPALNGKNAVVSGQTPDGQTEKSDQQMLVMQQMHRKMQTAKTPREREALKREFMKTVPMQESNGAMAGSSLLAEHNALLRRMDMMEAMVHMMVMDREPGKPSARKRK